MTAKRCRGPVRAALKGKGWEQAFTGEELDDLIGRLEAAKARRGSWDEAQAEVGDELLVEALAERRMRLAAARARSRREDLRGRMGGSDDRQLEALTTGLEDLGHGRGLSVDAQGGAMAKAYWGELDRVLRKHNVHDRLAPWHGFYDEAFEARVEIELSRVNGGREAATGDELAVAVASDIAPILERSRLDQNAEGAFIGRIAGYNGRQTHDGLRVAGGFWKGLADPGELARTGSWSAARDAAAAKAFGQWRDFIFPRLDPATFEGIEAALDGVDPPRFMGQSSARPEERFLAAVWWDIVTGEHAILRGADDLGDYRPPAGKARAVSRNRVLHFRDATARREYRQRYGANRSLHADLVGQLGRAGRNVALMRTFGPAPRASWEADHAAALLAARERNDTQVAKRLGRHDTGKLARRFDEIDGAADAPGSLRLATVGRLIRIDQSLSKLGGMALSMMSDQSIAVQTLARAGVPFLDGYRGVTEALTRLQGPEGRAIADNLDVGAKAAAMQLASRFEATDGPIGWAGWAMRIFYRVNGSEFMMEGTRRGVAQMLAAHYGREASNGWGALNAGSRETLERYGFDADSWELVRRHIGQGEDGRAYLTYDAVKAIPDADVLAWGGLKGKAATAEAAQRLRSDLELRLRTLVSDMTDTALTEARGRERSALTMGTKPGTVLGESVRLFTQFWSFPLGFMGRHVAPAAKGYAGKRPLFLLAHLILSTTVMGYVSMQAKQAAKGRTLRPLFDEDGSPRGDTFLAAMLQGGGLGIYGDFLFGEYNRFGGSPLGTLGGPAIGEMERAMRLFANMRDGEDFGPELARFVTGNTPFVNLFYTRLALDTALLWRLNEWMSPGWAARYERRVEEETGSGFIVRPSEVV